jgi:hypothetical protein
MICAAMKIAKITIPVPPEATALLIPALSVSLSGFAIRKPSP